MTFHAFNYDKDNNPRRILSCRKLSGNRYYIDGRIKDASELTKEEREAAEVFNNYHKANLDNSLSQEAKQAAYKAYQAYKKK